jgi:hypothetical protein
VRLFEHLLSGNSTRLFKELSFNSLAAIKFIGVSSGLELRFIRGDNLCYIRDGFYKLCLNKGSILLDNYNSLEV